MLLDVVILIAKVIIVLIFLLTGFAYMTLIERRVVARMQMRLGPNRVGPFGLLQPVADGLKMLTKESIIPTKAVVPIYLLAPMISATVAMIAWAVIPWGNPIHLFGREIPAFIGDANIGIIYIFAMTSLGVYGIILGGWSSGNKYSLLGSLRASAQVISYELSLGVAVIGVLMLTGSLRLIDIVAAQRDGWFILFQPLAFILYVIAATAEVNRAPFDLPEAEQELIAGYHTEYTGLRFTMFYMAEYINMITVSAVASILFLGGWLGPGASVATLWFLLKISLFLFFFIWLRATFPRLRYDRLMRLGWQVLLPFAVINLVMTSIVVAFDLPPWSSTLGSLLIMGVGGVLFSRQETHYIAAEKSAAIAQTTMLEGGRELPSLPEGQLLPPTSVPLTAAAQELKLRAQQVKK